MSQEPIVGLYEWITSNSFGYWIHKDGSATYALYRPSWWERIFFRITDGDRWVPSPSKAKD